MLLQSSHFYDIGLLGLMWLSDERDGELRLRARSFSPVFYTLEELELINSKQRRAATRDARLRMQIRNKLYLCADQGMVEKKIEHGTSHLAYLFRPSEKPVFEPARVLGRDGYKFYLTRAGIAYVTSKEGPYANIVVKDDFIRAHTAMRERVSLLMQLRRGQRSERDPEDFTPEELEEV